MKILNYEKIKDEGLTLEGVVIQALESKEEGAENGQGDMLYISDAVIKEKVNIEDYQIEATDEPTIVMFRDRIGIIFQRGSLNKYVSNRITFRIENILKDEESGELSLVYASLRMIAEERRDKLIEELSKDGAVIKAKIRKFKNNCAYLISKNKTALILKQKDFSSDWTRIKDIYKMGDEIEVMLADISPTKRISVRLPELYVSPATDESQFKEGMSLEGTIHTITTSLCFVRIAPGTDMLCPIPTFMEIEEGQKVKVHINQIKTEDHKGRTRLKIRGKIKGEIDTERFVLDYSVEDDEELNEVVDLT